MKKFLSVLLAVLLSVLLFFAGRISAIRGAALVSYSGAGYSISFNGYVHDYN